MLRLDLGTDELAATRFACSALQETVASLRVLDDPTAHTMHLPWYRDVAAQAARLELGLLRALVPADGYAPDFISPPPDSPLPDLDADLARVAATPHDRVRAEIAELFGMRTTAGGGGTGGRPGGWPADGRRPAATVVRGRPGRPLAPGPCPAAGRHLLPRPPPVARGGTRALFSELHPSVRWHPGGRLELAIAYEAPVALDQRGLLLVP